MDKAEAAGCSSGLAASLNGERNMENEINEIAAALAKAQMEMVGAKKDTTNPFFKSKYADLASVMAACLPALNKNGIAVVQPVTADTVDTMLIHSSGQSLKCSVHLRVSKDDMQGLGSAITYARRYGLMSMAGISPEDDDGNLATKAPPTPRTISADQFFELTTLIEETETNLDKFILAYGGTVGETTLDDFPENLFEKAKKQLQHKKEKMA